MILEQFTIKHYRSIEEITIKIAKSVPTIVFGPNNVGKSNLLKAIDCLIGERYASYIEFQDSDHFQRDKMKYPNISFSAVFDGQMKGVNEICFTTNHVSDYNNPEIKENIYHYKSGKKMFLSNEEKQKCHFVLIDASRDIGRQLSYFSQYSVLSKLSKRLHSELIKEQKDELDLHYINLQQSFKKVSKFQLFFNSLQKSFQGNVNGFEHKLEIDFSAYDPNNYFHALKVVAKEGEFSRAFDEFGTGEQQILLLSFIKAYAETFKGENFILGIEEPEAHLHPIAQRWLSKNIKSISRNGVQVIVTTHSPEFLDIDNVEGFVKVYKESGITKIKQNTAKDLVGKCLSLGANPDKTKENTIVDFYKTNTFYDHLKGFFARKILLVEGPTELFSLHNYFQNCGFDLVKNGVEIIDCRGKDQIARNYRLFAAFNYECFCLFDADAKDDTKRRGNRELGTIFGFDAEVMNIDESCFMFDLEKRYGYFGKDFEAYMRKRFIDYAKLEKEIDGTKPLKAKIISEQNAFQPEFITQIANSIKLTK